jgi:hypothetical protein
MFVQEAAAAMETGARAGIVDASGIPEGDAETKSDLEHESRCKD